MINKMKITGTHTALITPFNDNDSVDFKALDLIVSSQLNSTISGIVVLGTTAETPTLLESEQTDIVNFIINKNKELETKKLITVGVSSNSTSATIENAIRAETLGTDALLIANPYYNKPTQAGIIKHFQEVAKNTKLPIIAYNVPGRTALNIEPETLLELSKIENIVSVKDATGDINQCIKNISLIQKTKPNFTFLSGDDALAIPMISLGGSGVISVLSNAFPDEISKINSLAISNNFKEANQLFYKFLDIINNAFIETNPIPIKYIMSQNGFCSDSLRLPLTSLTKENKLIINKILKEL